MSKSWISPGSGESWKRPPASNDLTTLITRSIASTIRRGSHDAPSVDTSPYWQPLPTKTPIIGTIMKSETWRPRPAPVVGESWRAHEHGRRSETWRQRDRRDRRMHPVKESRNKESDLRRPRDRERPRSPPSNSRRDRNERRSSRWEPLSIKKSEESSRKASPEYEKEKVGVLEDAEESADDAADKLGPTCGSTVDAAWEARLNAALERDVICSLEPEQQTSDFTNPQENSVIGFADIQMPDDLIEIDQEPTSAAVDGDDNPSRSIPGLKFRAAKRLIVRAFKIPKTDVAKFYNNDKFKSILANPPTLALTRLTSEELCQWKVDFPPSSPVFRKRRQRTSANCVGRSGYASKQRQVRKGKEGSENRGQVKRRSLDVNDYFSDDNDNDVIAAKARLSDDDENDNDAKTSKDKDDQQQTQQTLPQRRPQPRRRPPPPPESLPPGLDFLAAATQPLPSFKIKKKAPVKEEIVEESKWKRNRGGIGNRPKSSTDRPNHPNRHNLPKPVEGSVVDRAHGKREVDSFFDRNLGHYRQAVRPRVKTPPAKIPDVDPQKKKTRWSSKENTEKVSDWLSAKPSSDRGPATPPGSGPDDSPADARLIIPDRSPAVAAVVQESQSKSLPKEEPLLAPDINPLDYVEELSNPGDDTDAVERQQFTKEDPLAGPSSSFVWTGTDEVEVSAPIASLKSSLLDEPLPIHHQTAHPSQHFHSATHTPILPLPVNANVASSSFVHGRQPLIPNSLLPTPEMAGSIGMMSRRSGSVEPRPRSSSSGVRSGSPMDLDDDCESRSRSPQVVGRPALLGGRPRALLAVPPEPSGLRSTPPTSTLPPRPPKQPLIPTPSPESITIIPTGPHHWRPKAPLLTEIVPERPRLNGPATKFVRPTPPTSNGSNDTPSSSSQSPLSNASASTVDDSVRAYTVNQLRSTLNILLKDPSSSLQNQYDRRQKAEQLLSILDDVEAMQSNQPTSLTQSMLKPIVQFVLDSSGLLK